MPTLRAVEIGDWHAVERRGICIITDHYIVRFGYSASHGFDEPESFCTGGGMARGLEFDISDKYVEVNRADEHIGTSSLRAA